MKEGAHNTESLIGFLTELREHFHRDPLVLIWDGLPSHRSKDMRARLATQQDWLHVERLPGYAPDLNPIEMAWGNLKS